MPADGQRQGGSELMRASTELVRARESFALSMNALEREIALKFEWREWVRRKPVTTLALAFGLGVLLGRRS